jgi:hypothetical protein
MCERLALAVNQRCGIPCKACLGDRRRSAAARGCVVYLAKTTFFENNDMHLESLRTPNIIERQRNKSEISFGEAPL